MTVRYDFQPYDPFAETVVRPHYWPVWLVDSLGVDYFATVIEVYDIEAVARQLAPSSRSIAGGQAQVERRV